ncbi:riboflavin biosynthesis protein RibF [Ornithinibacillus sp. 4-3]|uniref:Riboflavin biosynthesis protein n=1 Tax=Ornithinibacillus sp. 4-3 TaxID=3231488 RepID=A0AB39HRX7_9BACI
MKTIQLTYPMSIQEEIPATVAAIGFFDGIHIGHQQVIKSAVLEAKQRNMESAVITFHPHPSAVLKKEAGQIQYITPLAEKKAILENLYVDRLYIITFNQELSRLLPAQFIDYFIVGLNIKHLVAGFDYTYGFKGKGNMATIDEYAQGRFTHTIIEKLDLIDEKVSSTRIRECLSEGDIVTANLLLSRPLRMSGIVEKGDQRGRTIGYPTANIKIDDQALLPKLGVYAVHVYHQDKKYYGMANIGVRPTFKEGYVQPSVEVNILDFNQEIYNKEVQIELLQFIRPEKKFEGIDMLIAQIAEDEKKIRSFFA